MTLNSKCQGVQKLHAGRDYMLLSYEASLMQVHWNRREITLICLSSTSISLKAIRLTTVVRLPAFRPSMPPMMIITLSTTFPFQAYVLEWLAMIDRSFVSVWHSHIKSSELQSSTHTMCHHRQPRHVQNIGEIGGTKNGMFHMAM